MKLWSGIERWWQSQLDAGPRCSECGEPAKRQVTELTVADIHLRLPNAEPRCKPHAQILLRRL